MVDYKGDANRNDSNNKLWVELDFEAQIVFHVRQWMYQFVEVFNSNELEDSSQDCLYVGTVGY